MADDRIDIGFPSKKAALAALKTVVALHQPHVNILPQMVHRVEGGYAVQASRYDTAVVLRLRQLAGHEESQEYEEQ
jgi:hypothetical protein